MSVDGEADPGRAFTPAPGPHAPGPGRIFPVFAVPGEGERAVLRSQAWAEGAVDDEAVGLLRFTLKQSQVVRKDLDEFVGVHKPGEPRSKRKATWDAAADGGKGAPVAGSSGRWRSYVYADLVARDKCGLDLFWLRDESLEDSAKLPEPAVLAREIADDLRAALEQIEAVIDDLPQQ